MFINYLMILKRSNFCFEDFMFHKEIFRKDLIVTVFFFFFFFLTCIHEIMEVVNDFKWLGPHEPIVLSVPFSFSK